MRPLRSLDRPAQGLTAFFIALFAIPPAALLVGVASERSFWLALLPWLPIWVIPAVMRDPLSKLGRAPRFVAWFCIGVTGSAFFQVGRGEEFNLAVAAGLGVALAIVDLIVTLWSERKAAND
jgi:hypothetical protein